MKVAIYQPRASYYVGGGEVVALEHAKHLASLGHAVTLLTTRASFITQSPLFRDFRKWAAGVRIRYIEVPDDLKWIYDREAGSDWGRWHDESFHVGRLAAEWFRRHRFDLIALHNVVDAVAVPPGRKSVLHLHGYPDRLEDLQRVCLAIPDAHVAVSEHVRERWATLGNLKRCSVAYNGIDSGRYDPAGVRQDELDVVYAGRLVPIKGVEYLINAVAILKDEGVSVKAAIIGDGPYRSRLERLARSLKLGRDVLFLGRLPEGELRRAYQSSKIAVLPSYDREGVLTTMLEAASCGTPVVTTTAASMKEFLKHERNGILVPPKDAKALASAISRLLRDSDLRNRLGRQARKDVVAKWTWESRTTVVERLYEKAIAAN